MGLKLKTLGGDDVISILERFGFVVIAQTGSHVKLRRISQQIIETLVVPSHPVISKGTLKAIFNQASRYVPSSQLHEHFYSAER